MHHDRSDVSDRKAQNANPPSEAAFFFVDLIRADNGVVGLLRCTGANSAAAQEALDWIRERGGAFSICDLGPQRDWNSMSGYIEDIKVRQARGSSRLRLWMGDRNVDLIGLRPGSVTREQRQEIAALFPEAFVMQQRPVQ